MKRHFIYTTAILCLLTAYSPPKSTITDNLTIIDLETALKSPEGEMKLSASTLQCIIFRWKQTIPVS